MALPEYVTLNNTRYVTENLSEAAKVQVSNILVVDTEISRLQQQLAIAQMARVGYISLLGDHLKDKAAATPAKAKKPRAPRKPKAE